MSPEEAKGCRAIGRVKGFIVRIMAANLHNISCTRSGKQDED